MNVFVLLCILSRFYAISAFIKLKTVARGSCGNMKYGAVCTVQRYVHWGTNDVRSGQAM